MVSPPTVGRLLRQLGYSLQVNVKKHEASAAHPDRSQQFDHIEAQKQQFQAANRPVISVDTKKKELIGNFKNPERTWGQTAEEVNMHDFPQEAVGKAIPYGIDDFAHNRGSVYVGASADTAEFAVAAIARWWQEEGCFAFPEADHLLILADSGGGNGCRLRLWKHQLQYCLCDQYGLAVTVCHYPTGCSKWNPIEHRLFGQISLNWAGKPLRSFDTMLAYLRGTTTSTGLTVTATLLEGKFEKGRTVSDTEMKQLHIAHDEVCANWNYTLRPRVPVLSTS